MRQPLCAPMTIASCTGHSGKCQCVVPFWSRLAIARLAPGCSCHTGPCRGSESSVSMYNCQNGHNWQLPVWGQSGQSLLCMQGGVWGGCAPSEAGKLFLKQNRGIWWIFLGANLIRWWKQNSSFTGSTDPNCVLWENWGTVDYTGHPLGQTL